MKIALKTKDEALVPFSKVEVKAKALRVKKAVMKDVYGRKNKRICTSSTF